MSFALMLLVLALGWTAATGTFSLPNLLLGLALAAVALLLVRDRVQRPQLLPRLRRVLSLSLLFLRELFISAFKVAVLVVRPDMRAHLRPGIIAFPLTVTSDAEITTLANLITLTPGTLSVDVSADRRVLYIHAINVPDRNALVREISEGFEKKVAEAFR